MSPDGQSSDGRTGGPDATRRRVLATVAGAAFATGSARGAWAPQPPELPHYSHNRYIGSQEVIVVWDDPIDPCGSVIDHYEVTDGTGETLTVPAGINRARVTRGEISLRTVTTDGQRSEAVTTPTDSSVIVESSDTLSLDPAHGSIPPGASTWIPLRVHAGYHVFSDLPQPSVDSLSVSLTSPCAAEITDVRAHEAASGVETSISEDGSSASLSIESLPVCDGDVVGAIEVTARTVGHTSIVGDSSVVYRADPGRLHVSEDAEAPEGSWTSPGGTCGPDWPTDATDPDRDDRYEDISGNERIDFPDVNALFQNIDLAGRSSNEQYFDFSGDGTVDIQDVLALFEMV
ncbi:hypothetical protein [Halococcoides cellulosivorans]|uniref:EF-hand domain-containing protein n=1 Tax=Halococcoides cellulosivorans TaxID=1679096 RepID=A0A2R4X084_9EURY|nr:hypothetical protein [Halococcoides cellulosivorans]AWB27183.1 hypothetical protein HARCEL1_05425 [Halococcoides cellulosivorans]